MEMVSEPFMSNRNTYHVFPQGSTVSSTICNFKFRYRKLHWFSWNAFRQWIRFYLIFKVNCWTEILLKDYPYLGDMGVSFYKDRMNPYYKKYNDGKIGYVKICFKLFEVGDERPLNCPIVNILIFSRALTVVCPTEYRASPKGFDRPIEEYLPFRVRHFWL